MSFGLILLVLSCLAVNIGCGGGANSDQESAVVLTASVDQLDGGQYIEVEMVKDLAGTTALVNVTVSGLRSNTDESVYTVRLYRYDLRFERIDGGSPNLPETSGPLESTIGYSVGTSSSADIEFPVVSTYEKIYGDFAQEFARTLAPVEFRCYLTVHGRNIAGEELETTAGFHILCAVFEPYDELLPVISNFDYFREIQAGQTWMATWSVLNTVSSGILNTPFGVSAPLSGFDFPAGVYQLNTDFLIPTVEEEMDFPSATLIVSNPFGSVTQSGGTVTVTPAPSSSTPDPVLIEQFFADRYSLTLGESTNLTWVVTGGPTGIGMIPDTFSGVPVDFSDKNMAFDTVNVTPDANVRPIFRATKESNQTDDAKFLDQEIQVSGGAGAMDPEIVFFTSSHTEVPQYEQVAFLWKVIGDYEKLELFPINGQAKDVTGRESYLSPPLSRMGSNPFRLTATGIGGTPVVSSALTITVTEPLINEPVEITVTSQDPASGIDNGDEGAFSFRIDDPEHKDSSWRCLRFAGDSAVYGPGAGRIPGGHGDATVSFKDGEDSNNGFITFEIAAWDDDSYGQSIFTNKTVELVTYTTTGATAQNAPRIDNVDFTPGNLGTGLLPGQDGVISFTIVDVDTLNIFWTVEIIAGDRGGTLDGTVNYTQGAIQTGTGDVAVHYQDDPDSTDDAVVFQITATEMNEVNPQSDIAILRVDYLTDTDGTITFPHNGLYNNGTGIVDPNQRLSFYLNYDGISTTVPGNFWVDHNLTIPAPILSVILDIQHGSEDPGRIAAVNFERNFITPANDNENFGELLFAGYFSSPGEDTSAGAQASPPTNGVSRWYFAFDVESFRADTGTTYNLPVIDGLVRNYQIDVTAFDEDNTQEDILLLLQVESVR